MSLPLPPEIEVEDRWPESLRYRLPRRTLGRKRWFGLALIAVGLLTMASLVSMILMMGFGFRIFFKPWMFMLTVFVGIPTCGGIFPIWWGLAALCGRRELLVGNGKLRTREYVGPFFYGKSWPLAAVERLSVISVIPLDGRYPHPRWARHLDALVVFANGGNRGMLAWGYPHELLAPLANALAQTIERGAALQEKQGEAPAPKKVSVWNDYLPAASAAATPRADDDIDEDDDDDFVAQDVTVQPADSQIEVEIFDEGLTVKVPPSGLLRGTSGLFVFSLVWNGMMTAITVCGGFAALRDPQQVWNDGGPVIIGFFSLFWLVGIAILLASINMGRRRAAIAIAGDALMVIQSGPFGTRRREWLLGDVRQVVVGPSGMQVNDVDVLELQIHGAEGKKFGMLAGRQDAELYWLAWLVQSKVRALAPLADDEGLADPPPTHATSG